MCRLLPGDRPLIILLIILSLWEEIRSVGESMALLLLGVPDRQVTENETTSWETNKIGGRPDWFLENTQLPCCGRCQREMTLVTQVYCPLTNSPFHRCLHIFVCPSKPCSMQNYGWRVIRTQRLDDQSGQQSKLTSAQNEWTMDQDDWGVGQDDWGDGDKDDDDDGDDDGDEAENQDTLSTVQETTTNKLSALAISSNLPSQTTSLDSPLTEGTHKSLSQSPLISTVSDCPLSCGDDGDLKEKPSADFSADSETKAAADSEANDGDDGGGSSEQVEAEAMSLDEEGVERMMGLLAARKDCGKDQEGGSKDAERGGKKKEEEEEVFPAYYLDVFAETEVEDAMSSHVTSLLEDYQQREGQQLSALLKDAMTGQGASGADAEKYDRTEVKHGDKQCYKFIKTLQACPQQCIRYQWKGSPLLMSKSQVPLTVPQCQRCFASRVFELQLVPPLIPLLRLPGRRDPCVEYGTVLVFTCSNSCWSEGDVSVEEMVVLQQDPDQHLFR